MEGELVDMTNTNAWRQLLLAIEYHGLNLQQLLAVHTSICAHPEAEALVPSLNKAGLEQAYVTASGAWRVSLDLPALYAPGDGAAFHITVDGVSQEKVVQDLQLHTTYYILYCILHTTYYMLHTTDYYILLQHTTTTTTAATTTTTTATHYYLLLPPPLRGGVRDV